MVDDKIILQPLIDDGIVDDIGEEMISIFQLTFDSVSEATVDEEAKRVALEVQKRITTEHHKGSQEYIFESTWEGLLDIVQLVPPRHIAQLLLVKTLIELDATPTWKDLPILGQVMRDRWTGAFFGPDPDNENEGACTPSGWVNLNSFLALLFASGVVRWQNFPVWELREGLEEELSPGEVADCGVAAASEWLIQAAPALLRLCLIDEDDLDEPIRRSNRAGSLFKGNPGLNLERWGFWKRRLGEVRGTVSEETALSVDKALESMKKTARVQLVRSSEAEPAVDPLAHQADIDEGVQQEHQHLHEHDDADGALQGHDQAEDAAEDVEHVDGAAQTTNKDGSGACGTLRALRAQGERQYERVRRLEFIVPVPHIADYLQLVKFRTQGVRYRFHVKARAVDMLVLGRVLERG
ncbi:hypothetical protein G7Z17_g3063 [Cylindrodendrum hubeiense]|uniref:Uncharacterized protein n=1 Tax=Cylindrodendrum hubeiense TaxID=595255 RepID=A0A9P5HFC2_9HYPO|nr:hypothetical protein G7Z17_g3063 [Cylindrodendrum hubeiense]